ncbi:ribosome quality control complex subunit TCF25 [Phlebotomus argentipes]|uniref:ribosome quality control complex subunit TCF25 n=1 Tax=Phlebotomus argentipes TaxID=94469 RepID=UPI002893494A|nr:ribosome quality control complex subunit TCF25 [Phlebotomus argentipes]
MSSRVLKKLHGEELEIKQLADDQLSDVDTEISGGAKKKQLNINRYDLLNQQSPSESEVKEDDNETEHASAASNAHACEQAKKKKKRKKRKAGKQSSAHRRSSEDNADIDVITKTVREVDKLFGESYVLPASPVSKSACEVAGKSLLSVQHKNLNPSYEMKRMFGCRVVQAEQAKRRNTRGQRPLKSTWLVNVKENWPPVGKTGISMSVVANPEVAGTSRVPEKHVTYFTFEHSPSYRQLQNKFLAAVESMDSDNIIQIINQQPYHVDSLIQLSELCKMSEDNAMASDLIEHAIFSLESSFHNLFSLTSGQCRLDYRRQENRALFVVLFKHAQYLEARACTRTALEVSKLLLALDPVNDPLAVILVLDYYAIRAKQYEWLVELYNEWESSNNLSQLPNMAFSYALALFFIHKDDDCSGADAALQYALLMFPGILRPLLDALSIQVDSRANSHSYFGPLATSSQPAALQQLASLYICRSKVIWRDAEILPWLERNVAVVLDRVDAKDELVAEFATKRSQRYVSPPRAILRHIVLSDYKEKVPLAPFIAKENEPILMYDPLPPQDAINIYTRPNLSPTNNVLLQNTSPLSMFFQSLLPSFSMNQPAGAAAGAAAGANRAAAEADEPADEAAGFQSYTEFRNSLNSVVDALRDFLSNIRVPERPNDADVDENESTEDEANDYLT